jgi:hypothetical protein
VLAFFRFEKSLMDILTLAFKSALFDHKSAIELSKKIHPHALWSFKLSVTVFYVGTLLGGFRASHHRAHQFLAENAHRLPITKGGWYMYHRHKNYAIIREFIGKGTSNGIRMASWATLFGLSEYLFIHFNNDHWLNGAGAGFLTGGIFAAKCILN